MTLDTSTFLNAIATIKRLLKTQGVRVGDSTDIVTKITISITSDNEVWVQTLQKDTVENLPVSDDQLKVIPEHLRLQQLLEFYNDEVKEVSKKILSLSSDKIELEAQIQNIKNALKIND